MPTSITFNFVRKDRIPEINDIVAFEAERSMQKATGIVTTAVQHHMPLRTGKSRAEVKSEITIDLSATNIIIRGSVFSYDEPMKVLSLEEGRKPGVGLPIHVVKLFVQNVIRPPFNHISRVAFLINRHIALAGIQALHMFQKANEETREEVRQILRVELPARIKRVIHS